MKVLSIGNSFSQDAQKYLRNVAKSEGQEFKTVNLYIGACSLAKHYENMMDDRMSYAFEFNGEYTGVKISIRQALESDEWDVVTLQQVSQHSGNYETYTPYIEALVEYVKKYRPNAKIYIHETWAYEDGCERLYNAGFKSADEMYTALHNAYAHAMKEIKADGIIPSGTVMKRALELGIEKVHRDTFHASYGAGRYLLALTWYKTLTGNDISKNKFTDFDVPVTEREREIIIKAVNEVCG